MAGLGPEALSLVLGQESRGQGIAQNIIQGMQAKKDAEARSKAIIEAAEIKAKSASSLASDKANLSLKLKQMGIDSTERLAKLKGIKTPGELTEFQEATLGFRTREEQRKIDDRNIETRDFILNDKDSKGNSVDIDSRKLEADIENNKPEGDLIFYDSNENYFSPGPMKAYQIPSDIPAELAPHMKEIIIKSAKKAGISIEQQIKNISKLNTKQLIAYLEGI